MIFDPPPQPQLPEVTDPLAIVADSYEQAAAYIEGCRITSPFKIVLSEADVPERISGFAVLPLEPLPGALQDRLIAALPPDPS